MKIRVRPLNNGESFCCSVKAAKHIFQDTGVILNFAFHSRDYGTFAHTPAAYYFKNHIKGRVVASLYAHSDTEDSILSFYVLKQETISLKLKCEFETVYLPRFLDFYHSQLKKNTLSDSVAMMLVELYNGQYILHKKELV